MGEIMRLAKGLIKKFVWFYVNAQGTLTKKEAETEKHHLHISVVQKQSTDMHHLQSSEVQKTKMVVGQ